MYVVAETRLLFADVDNEKRVESTPRILPRVTAVDASTTLSRS